MINVYIVLFLFSVFIASISQVLLKISTNKLHKDKVREYINIYVIIAYILFFTSTLVTVFALRGIDLNRAPVFESIGYLYIMVLSRIVLNEKITRTKLIGNFIIIAGIIIFNI